MLAIAPPVKPTPDGADQASFVPAGIIPFTPSASVSANADPLQLMAVNELIVADGLIVTVTVKAAPVQFPATGVTT